MAVAALEAGWTNSNATGGSSPSHTHADPAGSDRCLVAFIGWEDTAATTDHVLDTLTVDSQSLTEQISDFTGTGGGTEGNKLWTLPESLVVNITTGAFTFGWAGATGVPDEEVRIYTRYFSGVDQAALLAGTSSGAANGVTTQQWDASVAYTDGDMGIYSCVAGAATSATVDESYTESFDDAGSAILMTGGQKAFSGSGSTQPTVTVAGTGGTRLIAVGGVLNAAAAGGISVPVAYHHHARGWRKM